MASPQIAVLPEDGPGWLRAAVVAGGGQVVDVVAAEALVWASPDDPGALADVLGTHPGIRWVQLPWAGVEPYRGVIAAEHERTWTCGKGVYAEPVAEHAMALLLAGMRGLGAYARRRAWDRRDADALGRNLIGARITVLGGGGIARSLLRMLAGFGAEVTVVRRHPDRADLDGAARVVGPGPLGPVLTGADAVVLALAHVPETERLIDAGALARMEPHAWLVNVARGAHVDTDALVEALRAGSIGGAALDVTDPEPLPAGHPLWDLPNAIVTPHVGNTPAMAVPLLAERITANVRRWSAGEELLGPVDPRLGY
ncbi:MAG: hydroxyacid dehydrogenase [Actinobacteria bacterium]|nr:hydroxyacid dehydrogenase [Actinomycetota bacterium]